MFSPPSRGRIGTRLTALLCLVVAAGLGTGTVLADDRVESSREASDNPFAPFFGEWTLKNDRFRQVWDGRTVETLTIPNHHTRCAEVNTRRTVLCVVDAGDLKGHILWSYDDVTKQVHHLSHFGTARNGVGVGTLDGQANLTSKVSFQGEPDGSYRQYRYTWVSKDEYAMMSIQFDRSGRQTGNWYGGTFIRVAARSPTK